MPDPGKAEVEWSIALTAPVAWPMLRELGRVIKVNALYATQKLSDRVLGGSISPRGLIRPAPATRRGWNRPYTERARLG